MFRLYSDRLKDRENEVEVFEYDVLPDKFRHQLLFIINDVISGLAFTNKRLWTQLHNAFCREKGLESLGYHSIDLITESDSKDNFREYLDRADDEDILDLVDFVFQVFDKHYRAFFGSNSFHDVQNLINNAITELNFRFQQHHLGYEYTNGEIIRVDNKVIHKEYIKPALNLLCTAGFEGAEEEYKKAFDAKLKGDNKIAIIEAEKAFESTMKTICTNRGYPFDKDKDTAKKLISILRDNQFLPAFSEDHLNTLVKLLENGSPTVRNKTAGHGQGKEVANIPNSYAEYVLGIVAVNMVLLVKLYNEG